MLSSLYKDLSEIKLFNKSWKRQDLQNGIDFALDTSAKQVSINKSDFSETR